MARKIIFGILVALVIIFVAQNTQVVEVRFLVWKNRYSFGFFFTRPWLRALDPRPRPGSWI